MQIRNVAIVAPGGNVGTATISELLKDTQFHLTALIRPLTKYTPPQSASSIKVIVADHEDKTSLVKALQNQDALLSCVPGGATKFAGQQLLIDATIEAGIQLFFASEYSADVMGPLYQRFPTQVVGDKVKIRQYLMKKADAGEIAYTAINGGPFFDMWLRKGVAGFNIPARKATIYGTGNNLACWTPLPVIAKATANMLRKPDEIKNRAIFVCGVRGLTQNTILAALEAETGHQFEREVVDVQKIRNDALEALEAGELGKATRGLTINAQFNEHDSAANFWHLVENELVGVEAVDVREAVREYLAESVAT